MRGDLGRNGVGSGEGTVNRVAAALGAEVERGTLIKVRSGCRTLGALAAEEVDADVDAAVDGWNEYCADACGCACVALLRFAAGADAVTSSSSIAIGDAPARRDFRRFGAAAAAAATGGCCAGIFTCSGGAGPRADWAADAADAALDLNLPDAPAPLCV